MTTAPSPSGLDRWPARVVALVLAVVGVALMAWLGRDELFRAAAPILADGPQSSSAAPASAAADNPALAACLAERVGAVDKMKAEGIVSAAQYDTFKSRAVAYCETEFPPSR